MDILIVGTGYVGLVSGACFAEMGHHVICLDINTDKINALNQGIIPFYEPGLEELVKRNASAGRMIFTSHYKEAVERSLVCFLALPTPSQEDGSCKTSYLMDAVEEIARHMDGYRLIVNKSTAPVGTCHTIKDTLQKALEKQGKSTEFSVVANPEFLKEGSAVSDCLKPDRIILGVDHPSITGLLKEMYSPFTVNHDRILIMDILSAEMTKYAANAMLALRISFMNELSLLCEKVGANIKEVRIGIGADERIGYDFLYAGIGYGGSCFPKDLRALQALAKENHSPTPLLEATELVNQNQRELFFQKIKRYFAKRGGLRNKTVAIWGLSFKPETDDMREAPSLTIIERLLEEGAFIRAYDPISMPGAKKLIVPSAQMHYASSEYEAAKQADAIALITEWKQFRFVSFDPLLQNMKGVAFFDGRNQYKAEEMEERGFDYFGIGIPTHAHRVLTAHQDPALI